MWLRDMRAATENGRCRNEKMTAFFPARERSNKMMARYICITTNTKNRNKAE